MASPGLLAAPAGLRSVHLVRCRLGLEQGDGDMQLGLSDPSYPAFYMQGQADHGNIRAFAALDPCRGDGEACGSGVDCCSGYCTEGICGPQQQACAETKERCDVDGDCCPPIDGEIANTCVGGFCDFILLE